MADNKNTLLLKIVSPMGTVFSQDVDQVTLPSIQGEITLLPHHTALFTKLSDGEAYIKQGNKTSSIAIIGGFLEVKNNKANVITEYAVHADNIQTAKAEEARKKAEEIMKNKKETVDFVIAEKELQKSVLELNVAEKIKRRHRG